MCVLATTRCMPSTGHREPAMMPVRGELRSYVAKSGRSSSAMNSVGTPCSEVHRSRRTASGAARGSKERAGITTQAPWDVAAGSPLTMPKQCTMPKR
jgi:hypothetical protein